MIKVALFSDSKPGSNTEAIYDFIKDMPNVKALFVEKYKIVCGEEDALMDIAITNNLRCLGGKRGLLTVNTQHGNFFLGDTSDETDIDLYTAASQSEKSMMTNNGVPNSKIVITGCARTDRLFRHTQAKDEYALEQFYKQYNVRKGQKTFLYAPTYDRSNLGFGKKGFFACSLSEQDEINISKELMGYINSIDAKLIIRVHKYYKRKWPNLVPSYLGNIFQNTNTEITSNETHPDSIPAIIGSDVLITDFSSIVADFLPMKKPVIFIEPNEHWIYTDRWHVTKGSRPFLGRVIYSHHDVVGALDNAESDYTDHYSQCCETYVKHYVPYFDGDCSKRNWEAILNAFKRC